MTRPAQGSAQISTWWVTTDLLVCVSLYLTMNGTPANDRRTGQSVSLCPSWPQFSDVLWDKMVALGARHLTKGSPVQSLRPSPPLLLLPGSSLHRNPPALYLKPRAAVPLAGMQVEPPAGQAATLSTSSFPALRSPIESGSVLVLVLVAT